MMQALVENTIRPIMTAHSSLMATYFPGQLIMQVLIIGIICGVGIPCLYALGLKTYSISIENTSANLAIKLGTKTLSYLIFALCTIAVLIGIFLITLASLENILHLKF